LQLDRPKASRGRRRETLDQRALGEKIREIGGEAGHEENREEMVLYQPAHASTLCA
jgi:hypothetical protein